MTTRRRVLLVLGGFAVLFTAYRLTLHWLVAAELRAIRQQDEPVTIAELGNWLPIVPSNENAAIIYEQAFQQFDRSMEKSVAGRLPIVGTARSPALGEPLTADMRPAVAEYLAANEPALRLLHATPRPRCRYAIEFEKGTTLLLPHLASVRHGMRLLMLEALWFAETNLTTEAVESVTAAFSLAGSLRDEPILVSQLCRWACDSLAIDSLNRTVNAHALTDSELQRLLAGMTAEEDSAAFVQSVIGDRCFGNTTFAEMRAGKIRSSDLIGFLNAGEKPLWYWLFVIFYKHSGVLDLDQYRYLKTIRSYLDAARLPLPAALSASRAVAKRVERHLFGRLTFFTMSTLSTFDWVFTHQARAVARLRTARISLEVERARLRSGVLPESLPAVPTDPFTGEPLRYKQLAKGYLVYSVGEDGQDDGGDVKKDIAFTVER